MIIPLRGDEERCVYGGYPLKGDEERCVYADDCWMK
jgi:hypothetical protein